MNSSIFGVKAGSQPKEWGTLLAIPGYVPQLQVGAWEKHSSLFSFLVNDETNYQLLG
jgi:hypothetical protein